MRLREPVNGLTHLTGALLAAGGLLWLLRLSGGDPTRLVAVLLYGASTIFLYASSAAYHLINGSAHTLLWLRRLDHAAIYLLIAGSYTPIYASLLDGNVRWLLLALIWALALAGAAYKLLFMKEAGRRSLLLYVGMGWVGTLGVPQTITALPPGAAELIAAGALSYMLGAAVFGLQRPNFHRHFGHHEIWHLFVMGGSALHFAAVVRCLR